MPTYAPAKRNPYPVARPTPETWQQGQEQSAQDLWNQQYDELFGNLGRASGAVDDTSAGSAAAQGRVAGFTPAQTMAYDPQAVRTYSPMAYFGWTPGAASRAFQSMSGGGRSGSMSPPGGATAKFSADDVSNFDPEKYGKEFAAGAEGDFNKNLDIRLQQLESQAGGTGRLKSGFYDRDTGRIVRDVATDYNTALSKAAVDFSGQKLNALESGAGMRLSAAQSMDQLTEQGREYDMGFGERAAEFGASTALSEEQLQAQMGTEEARLGLSRATTLDASNYQRAHDIDTSEFQAGTTALDAALRREQMARGSYDTGADRMASYASATRDWAASDRQTQDQRDQFAALLAYRRQQDANYVPPDTESAVSKANRAVAKSMGVPYFG